MADNKYCSTCFKTGEELDAALQKALRCDDNAARAEAAANRAEAAAEGAQSDWNQNDSAADDYVKNRPFYRLPPMPETGFETETNPDGSITSRHFREAAEHYGFYLEAGRDYTVVYDEAEYTCRSFAYEVDGGLGLTRFVGLGNGDLGNDVPAGWGSGAPFFVCVNSSRVATIYCAAEGYHYIDISSVVKLPNEYLDMDGIKEAIGSAGAVQPDWNQNDATKPDYIKNRPISEAKETVIIEDQTVTTTDEWGEGSCATLSTQEVLEVGKTYMVMFNGTAYECVAYHPVVFNGETSNTSFSDIVLGKSVYLEGIVPGVEHQGTEPFAIIQSTTMSDIYVYVAKDGTYTVKVTEYEVKLNPNYLDMDAIKTALPTMEMVATLEDGTTATYKLYGEVVE